MKKRILWCLMTLVLVSGITACGTNTENAAGTDKDETIGKTDYFTGDEQNDSEEEESENWGVDESLVTEKNNKMLRLHIKFPQLGGIVEGTGKIAYQKDNSLVLLGGENNFNEPEVEGDKLDNILPAYFDKVIEIMEAYREYDFKDFVFEITDKELVTVNDYEMCKYTGIHTFTFKDEPCEMAFVAYATRLKGNDAVAYWMVLDETEDQSLGEVIESHADKMAQTLHE